MASSDSPLTQPNPPNTSDTVRLRGPWLTATRLIWIVVAVVGVSLYIASIPYRINALNPDCQAQICSPEEELQVSEIQRVGLPGTFVAWYFIVVDTFVTVVYGVTGALIFWRRSGSRVALFVAFMLLGNGLTFGPEIYFLVEANPALFPLFVPLLITGYGFLIVFLFIFPDGRFVPRWTRWLAFVFLAGQAFMLIRDFSVAYYGRSLLYVGYLLAGGAIGVGAQIYRYRRVSTPAQRQQTKWVMLGAAGVLILTFIGIFPAFFNPALLASDLPYRMLRVPLFGALPAMLLPIAIMVSILRYRLWDIDFVINRSLVYGTLTTLLLALFGGSLLIVNGLFQNFAGGPLVALTLSAAVFGAVFQPARRRLQRFVDQRFYHIYIDYQKTPLPAPPLDDMTQVLRQTDFGAYQNLELIGRGGMAEVYKSTHPTLNTPVAIKILPTTLAAQADFRQRFTREAQVVAKLEHPNIVRVFDYGQQAIERAKAVTTPVPGAFFLDLADHCHEYGDEKHCRYLLEYTQQRYSDDENVLMGIAVAYLDLDEDKRAVPILRRILNKNPNHIEANIQLGLTYYYMNQNRLAQRHWKTAESQARKNNDQLMLHRIKLMKDELLYGKAPPSNPIEMLLNLPPQVREQLLKTAPPEVAEVLRHMSPEEMEMLFSLAGGFDDEFFDEDDF